MIYDFFHLFALCFAAEGIAMGGWLPCEAILLPLTILFHDEGLDTLNVISGYSGIGVSNQFRQRAFVRRYTQHRFLAAKRLIELGCQHAVSVSAREHQHDTATPDSIAESVMRDRIALGSVDGKGDW